MCRFCWGPAMAPLPEELRIDADGPSAVAVGDMDGDSRDDLVVAYETSSVVAVFLGNGDGTFIDRIVLPVGDGPESVVVDDIDGDGNLDVVTADTFGDSVTILPGSGDGSLRRSQRLQVGMGPCGLGTGDLDGDGDVDLVVGLGIEGRLLVLRGVGRGKFVGPCVGDCGEDGQVSVDELVRGVNIALGGLAVEECAAFDVDGDGTVTVDELVRGVNGALDSCGPPSVGAGETPAGLVVADLNRDTVPDVALADRGSDALTVLFGLGDGSFDAPEDVPSGALSSALLAADLDSDGRLDLVTTHTFEDLVSVLVGEEGETFAEPEFFSVHSRPSGAIGCRGLVNGDVNGDGTLDLITANEESDDVTVLINETPGAAAVARGH